MTAVVTDGDSVNSEAVTVEMSLARDPLGGTHRILPKQLTKCKIGRAYLLTDLSITGYFLPAV